MRSSLPWIAILALAVLPSCGSKSTQPDQGPPDVPAVPEPAEDTVEATGGESVEDATYEAPPPEVEGSDAEGIKLAEVDCTPDCEGKTCGDDGCGGSCGSCLFGAKCVEGQCCKPACSGKKCGDDGCGGSCGECQAGTECKDGQCLAPCKDGAFGPVEKVCSWKPMHGLTDPRGYLFYQETNATKFPMSGFRVEIRQYKPFNGPQVPGTYVLDTDDYKKCRICLQYYENCDAEGCDHLYLATEGKIEITALDGAKGPFEAILHDVVFKDAKIDIDWNTQINAKGPTLCMDGHEVASDVVELAVPEKQCVKAGTGVMYDKNIADFKLVNCNGHPMSLHAHCGKEEAMWIMLVTSWCSVCAEFVPAVYEYYLQILKDDPGKLGLWIVIGEDINKGTIDQDECMQFAKQHGVDPEMVFYDPTWETTMKYIYPYGFSGIPYNMLLDGDNMAYYWSSGSKGDLNNVLWTLQNDLNDN